MGCEHAWLADNRFQVNRLGPMGLCCNSRPRLPRTFVNTNIFLGRSVPGEILLHAITHEVLPGALIPEGPERFLDRQQQSFTIVVGELEPGTLTRTSIPVFDSVIEPAGSAHHWDRAIFQAIDLIEAAGLVF